MRFSHIALLTTLSILILSSYETANSLDHDDPTYQGAESSASESSIQQDAPSGTEPQSAPEDPLEDAEQTPTAEMKRKFELWAKDSLRTAYVDFSLPPARRKVEYRDVKLMESGITFNEILWLLRGEEDYRSKPVMGEIYTTEAERYTYHINITDDSFSGNENYFNDVINTVLYVKWPDLQGIYVIVERNGTPDTSLSTYEENRFNFIDYEKNADYLYTPDEIIRFQHEIPYVPMAFDSVSPMFSEEDLAALLAERRAKLEEDLAALSTQKRAELETLWHGDDETSHRLITYLSSVMTSLVDYETLSFASPDEAPDEFILRTAWLATNRVFLSDTEDDNNNPIALEMIRNIDPLDSYSCLLGEHVEKTARLIFGDSVNITHRGGHDKTWGYYPYGHYYTHFPGGTGDRYLGGIYPYYTGYQDLGDRYEVSILLVNYHLDSGPWLRNVDEEITPENAYELLTKHALRAKVTLLKRADGSLQYQAYEPLGTPSV